MHVSVHRWIPSKEKIKEPAAGRPSRHRVAPGSQHAKGNNSEKRRPLRGSRCGTLGGQILVLRKQLRLKNARCRRSAAERAAKTPAAEPDGFSKKSHRPQWMARARGGVPAAPQRREMLRLPNDQTSTKSTHSRVFSRHFRCFRSRAATGPQRRVRGPAAAEPPVRTFLSYYDLSLCAMGPNQCHFSHGSPRFWQGDTLKTNK